MEKDVYFMRQFLYMAFMSVVYCIRVQTLIFRNMSKRVDVYSPVSKEELHSKATNLILTFININHRKALTRREMNIKIQQIYTILGQDQPPIEVQQQLDEVEQEHMETEELMEIDKDNANIKIATIGIEEDEEVERLMFSNIAHLEMDVRSSSSLKQAENVSKDVPLKKDSQKIEPKIKNQEESYNYKFQFNPFIKQKSVMQQSSQTLQNRLRLSKWLNYIENQPQEDIKNSETPEINIIKYEQSEDENNSISIYQQKHPQTINKIKLSKRKRTRLTFKRNKSAGRRPVNPLMESILVVWIKKMLESGYNLSQGDIRRRAQLTTTKLGQKEEKFKKFAASKGWIEKFLRRHPEIASSIGSKDRSHVFKFDSEELPLVQQIPELTKQNKNEKALGSSIKKMK